MALFSAETLETFKKCPMCKSVWAVEINIPLMLTCGHTFCAKCISKEAEDAHKEAKQKKNYPEFIKGLVCKTCNTKWDFTIDKYKDGQTYASF